MAKIRGFKPDLWTDEDFVEVSPFARLLWLGMWNFSCDNGHIQDKSKQIKMRILPTDDVNCAELLRELEAQNLIERADGWIFIPNLTHHQKPHKRWWVTCDKPGCEMPEGASYGYPKRESTVEQPLSNASSTVNNGGSTADVDVDGEVDGDRAPRKRGERIPEEFAITPTMLAWVESNNLGHLNLEAITGEFIDYWIGVPGQKGVKLDWESTWRNWIRRKSEDGPRRGGSAAAPRDQWSRATLVSDGS